MLSKGFLTDARRLARDGIAKLAAAAADGVPILGLEPSCVLTLADEWPELVPGAAAKRVAAAAEMADGWLARQARDNALSLDVPELRTAQELDRDVERVGVQVGDAQLRIPGGHGDLNLAPGPARARA